MILKYYMRESHGIKYEMMIGRDILILLGLDINFYKNNIVSGVGPYGGCT